MSTLISLVIWSVASYFIAKNLRDKEGLNVNPWNYALMSFVCSFLFSMGVLTLKWGDFKNKSGCRVAGWIMIATTIIINVLILL